MSDQMVITALGADRPGIVDELSQVLYSQNLNIEDSRMSSLGGAFAILLLVTGSKQAIDEFIGKTRQIEAALQMQLLVRTSEQCDNSQTACALPGRSCRHGPPRHCA